MSADNWAVCPQCKYDAEEASRKAKLKAGASYGKVEPEEYLAKLEAANRPVAIDSTFREDYGIGVDEAGLFYASYTGQCSNCGLMHEFKHETQLKLKKAK